MSAGLLVGDWDFFYPRYLYGVLPAAGVAIGIALGRAALPYAATVDPRAARRLGAPLVGHPLHALTITIGGWTTACTSPNPTRPTR